MTRGLTADRVLYDEVRLPITGPDQSLMDYLAPAQLVADAVAPKATAYGAAYWWHRLGVAGAIELERITAAYEHMTAALAITEERMTRYREDVLRRFAVEVHAHPRLRHVGVLSASDYDRLTREVMDDPRLDAVGRGYYLAMGGAVVLQVGPDWTFSPVAVAQARLLAIVRRPLARALKAVTCVLELHLPNACTGRPERDTP